MNRRKFIKNIGIGSVSSSTIQGCATIGGYKFTDHNELNLSEYLNTLDQEIERINHAKTSVHENAYLQEHDLPSSHTKDSLIAMLTISALRDLPESAQRDERVQRRYKKELPRVGQLALNHIRYLKSSPKEEREKVQQTLLNNPEIGTELRLGILEGGEHLRVPSKRQNQLDEILKDVEWKFSKQNPSLLIKKMQNQIERATKKSGIAPDEWDELIELDLNSIGELDIPKHEFSSSSNESNGSKGLRLFLLGILITGLSFVSGFITVTLPPLFVLSVVGTFIGLYLFGAGIFYIILSLSKSDEPTYKKRGTKKK